jgi:hypothetical protein
VIRRRFPGSRLARLFGWTAIAVAWSTAAIVKVAGTSPQPDTPAEPEPSAEVEIQNVPEAVPEMPDGGLTVIRYTPAPPPEPVVVTRVVEQRVVVQSAPRPTSSGS